jgi:D-alanine-D-alanine ligase
MNIAVLFDDVEALTDAAPDDWGVLEAVAAVHEGLASLHHHVSRVPVTEALTEWLGALRAARADVVFNLCEAASGSSAHEPHVAGVIELLGLPLTGCGADTLALARRKDRVNAVLAAGGVAVPAWTLLRADDAPAAWTHFPAIVKPAGEDASVGVTQASVARDRDGLAAAVSAARAHAPLLLQEYVAGRELNVGFVGAEMLPIAEIDYTAMPAGAWPIVSYAAKWETGSAEDLGTVPVCPAPLAPVLAARVAAVARTAWRLIDGTGYGRVDLRVADDGTPYVLEINPNPDLSPGAGLARMAGAAGWSYARLVERIVEAALAPHEPGTRRRTPAEPAVSIR